MNPNSPCTVTSFNALILCSPSAVMGMQHTMWQSVERGPRGWADKVLCDRAESWPTAPAQALSMSGRRMCAMRCRQNGPPFLIDSTFTSEEAADMRGQSPKEVGIVLEVFVSVISADRPQASLSKKRAIWSDNTTPRHAAADHTNAARSKAFSKFSMDKAESDDATSPPPLCESAAAPMRHPQTPVTIYP